MKFTDKGALDKLFPEDNTPPPQVPGDGQPGDGDPKEGEGQGKPQDGDMSNPTEVPQPGQLPEPGGDEPAWVKHVKADWNLDEQGQDPEQQKQERFGKDQHEFMRRMMEMWQRMMREQQEKGKPKEVDEMLTILLLAVEGLVADFEAGLYEDFPEVREETVRKVRRFVRELVDGV